MDYNPLAPSFPAWLALLLTVLVAWTIVWKGLALWRAARNKSVGWFVVLFLLNTAGILEILYLTIWGRDRSSRTPR